MDDKKQQEEKTQILMSARDLQAAGFPRAIAYKLLNRPDLPVVRFGQRRFMIREKFLLWLEQQSVNP